MKINPALNEAIDNFRALGWANATRDQAPHLPLGTPEQQRKATKGLNTGDWGEYGQIGEHAYGWISAIDVDEGMLALYAIRCGVHARRAVQIARHRDAALAQCILQRGDTFMRSYLKHYYRPSTPRMHEHTLSASGSVAVELVGALGGQPLDNIHYLKDWAALALYWLTENASAILHNQWIPDATAFMDTFPAHIRAAVEHALPATGPFADVFAAAVEHSLIDRDTALQQCLYALDAAVRPGDRKAYTRLLLNTIHITPEEILTHSEILTTVIATGDTPVVEAFAPPLIEHLPPERAIDTALPALYAKTAKTRLTVLKAIAARHDIDAADALPIADRLAEIATSTDQSSARIAHTLLNTWNLNITTQDAATTADNLTTEKGLWQPTPPLWRVPQFTITDTSLTALHHAITNLRSTQEYLFDLEGDRVLAIAVAAAHHHIDDVRHALNTISDGLWISYNHWAHLHNTTNDTPTTPSHPETIYTHLGTIPCLLSTPSHLDSSITYTDLVTRLNAYAAAGASVLDTDLVLALIRLDLATINDTPLPDAIPITTRTTPHTRDAATVIRDYIHDPIPEGTINTDNYFLTLTITTPASLHGLPLPFNINHTHGNTTRLFPHWANAAYTGLLWSGQEITYAGLCAQDASYSARPLPPAAAINLIALQRPTHPKVAPHCAQAIRDAWERGLLIPGQADIQFLDWDDTITNLAALAHALQELSEIGMLSVTWPILDDLITASLNAPRLISGTAEVAQVMAELAPEVRAAITHGHAPTTAANTPGLRALAQRPNKNKATRAAHTAISHLPHPTDTPPHPNTTPETTTLSAEEFTALWPHPTDNDTHTPDGAHITGFDTTRATTTAATPVTFTLDTHPDETYTHISANWYWAITNEAQAHMLRRTSTGNEETGYLRWNGTHLTFTPHRNWHDNNDSPLNTPPSPPSNFLTKIIIADLATAPDPTAPRAILTKATTNAQLSNHTVHEAVTELLPHEQWSPARAVYILEKAPELLHTLWPLLTEPITYAAHHTPTPRWLNRVLDITLLHAPILREATARGHIPQHAWEGLRLLSQQKGKTAALTKARTLAALLVTSQ